MDGNNFENNNYQDNTANIPYQAPAEEAAPVTTNGLQIAGLVLGILAIVSCWFYGLFGIIFGIAGLICSILGNKKGKTGVGTAGLICSIIGIILGVIGLIYYVVVLGAMFSMMSSGELDVNALMNEMYNY